MVWRMGGIYIPTVGSVDTESRLTRHIGWRAGGWTIDHLDVTVRV